MGRPKCLSLERTDARRRRPNLARCRPKSTFLPRIREKPRFWGDWKPRQRAASPNCCRILTALAPLGKTPGRNSLMCQNKFEISRTARTLAEFVRASADVTGQFSKSPEISRRIDAWLRFVTEQMCRCWAPADNSRSMCFGCTAPRLEADNRHGGNDPRRQCRAGQWSLLEHVGPSRVRPAARPQDARTAQPLRRPAVVRRAAGAPTWRGSNFRPTGCRAWLGPALGSAAGRGSLCARAPSRRALGQSPRPPIATYLRGRCVCRGGHGVCPPV